MLHYILQTVAFQLFFLVIYDLFLKKETFFNWNRTYLLGTSALSLAMPFIKINSFKNIVPQEMVIKLPEIILNQENESSTKGVLLEIINMGASKAGFWELFFLLGLLIATIVFLVKIFKISVMIYQNPKLKREGFLIIKLLDSNAAFSFFNYVFLGEMIKQKERDAILNHEIIHVKQKHTIDLIYFEILRIIFWFNPFVYMYQERMSTLHEFTADAKAVKNKDIKEYYQNLLSQVFETEKLSFINTFFKQSLIKKRIIMLSKSKSKEINLLKYALLIPIVLGMLVYTSCTDVQAQKGIASFEEASVHNTPLIKKIKAMKKQMEIQGGANDEEQLGIDLLFKAIMGTELDAELVKEVQMYTAKKSKTPLMQKITDVFEQIQIQGNLTKEEEKSLKTLLMLITKDGLNNPLFQEVVEYAEIPFGVIDQVPTYPGCETLPKENQKKCTTDKIAKHLLKNFNTKIADSLKMKGRIKIMAMFTVSNKGVVEHVKAKAPREELENEAVRVIKMLPKMKPGVQSGKAVNVPYSLPIIFQVKE